MDEADAVVDNESDLSSDTEEGEESEEEYDSCEEEEEEEESDDEDDDYSDDDSFVTSNEDANREEKEEVIWSYRKVFDEDRLDSDEEDTECIIGETGLPNHPMLPEIDYSVGGYVAGTGEM